MDIIRKYYNHYYMKFVGDGINEEEDYDVISTEIIKDSMIKLNDIHDNLMIAFMEPKPIEEYIESFNISKNLAKELIESSYALSYLSMDKIVKAIDNLAEEIEINGTSYYKKDSSISEKIDQISKFTNNNTLQSFVISTISGERFNMDFSVLREHLFNLYLSYSRLLKKINNEEYENLEQSLLELLIFNHSLSILFNIEKQN